MRLSAIALAAAIAAGTFMWGNAPSAAAPAASLAPLKSIAGESMVEKTHGWHRRCRHGLTDVHKHVPGVGRVACTTHKCYTNRFGVKRCTWY